MIVRIPPMPCSIPTSHADHVTPPGQMWLNSDLKPGFPSQHFVYTSAGRF
jgi:hypothetical protein